MPFYEGLSHFLTKDRAAKTLNTYSTMGEPHESLADTTLEEKEVQGSPSMVGQLGAQEKFSVCHRAGAQLLQ